MHTFILEIGVEEIPPIYIDKAIVDLKNIAIKDLKELNIDHGNVQTFGTPRRLSIYIDNIKSKQRDISKKIKGPSKNISFDSNGSPLKPAIKFANANHVKVEELIAESTEKGDYLFVEKNIEGKKTETLLPKLCLNLINGLNFSKSMRWGNNSFRFIRPIRWMVALLDDKIVPFELENIKSDCISYGHRLLHPKPVKIYSAEAYSKIMEACFVIIDPEKRKKIILKQINNNTKKISGKDYIDEKLMDEVKNLVEYPRVLLGKYDESYLKLPPEVLEAVMIKHQKYFPVYSKKDGLLPFFFVVINGNKSTYKNSIIQGNERVLKARLEDAKFFYQEDQRVSNNKLKPLDNFLVKLKDVIYQENIGSMYDKVERIIALSEIIGNKMKLDRESVKILKRSAQLCKSDLVSEMVKEFPELQGIMGKEYAILQGEDRAVADAIFEHYLPRFSDDSLPNTIYGTILSIADKLDNITSCFVNNNIPDGSQDPYALRRQSLGIINILLSNNINISFDEIINHNINLLLSNDSFSVNINIEELKLKIKEFILQRLRYLFIEKGYNYDIIDAVLLLKPNNVIDAFLRIEAIQGIYKLPKFNRIITAATRTYNLSKNTEYYKINQSIFKEVEEKILYENYIKTNDNIKKALDKKNYREIFDTLESITESIDIFFDNVLVMDKDEEIKKNRLALLKNITDMYCVVADLSKIALAKG